MDKVQYADAFLAAEKQGVEKTHFVVAGSEHLLRLLEDGSVALDRTFRLYKVSTGKRIFMLTDDGRGVIL